MLSRTAYSVQREQGSRSSQGFLSTWDRKASRRSRPSGTNPITGDGFRSPINEQVIDEKNGVLRLLLEMPGVEKDEIQVDATEDRAIITAESAEKKYRAELGLQAPVRPDSGKAEYKNGMLEISFSLKDKANKGYKRVNVV